MSSSLPTAPGITPLALAGTYPPGCLNPLTLDRVFSSRRRPQLQQPPAPCPGTSAARRGRIACSRSRPAGLPPAVWRAKRSLPQWREPLGWRPGSERRPAEAASRQPPIQPARRRQQPGLPARPRRGAGGPGRWRPQNEPTWEGTRTLVGQPLSPSQWGRIPAFLYR